MKQPCSPCASQTEAQGVFHAHSSIHPTAIIGPDVSIGSNVTIDPYAIIHGNVTIEDDVHVHSHVSIGAAAQDVGTPHPRGTITIGQGSIIREFASIHASKIEGGSTRLGTRCYIMTYSHVAHDCQLGDNVILINNVSLGGHTKIDSGAIIMASAATHQRCHIGAYTALAPFSGTRQDLPPYCIFEGQPGRFAGLNRVALKRAGFSRETINALRHVARCFFQKKQPLATLIKAAAAEPEWGADQHVQNFLTFIKESTRGISRKTINDPS